MLPLKDITVVAMEQAVAAPFATRQLADLGARVIKIERRDGGDFARSYDTTVRGICSQFVWLNRGKESLTLDLKRPEAAGILARLFARADVVVQNLAPGAAGRLGAGPSVLRARHPRLIVCTVSGYGSSGPFATKKAYDNLVQSEAGVISITGTEDHPSKVGISVADIAAGMYAYSGILTALLNRTRTGDGAAFEVSLFDALGEWMGYPIYYTMYGGEAPARTGANHASIAPYGPLRTGDGGTVFLAIQNAREWARLCTDVLQRPELVDDERFRTNPLRVEHRPALHAAIEAVFARFTAREVMERLESAQIANARMNTVTEYLEHPQLTQRDAWREIDSPVGPLKALLPPVRMEGVEPAMGPIPSLGQHTEAVLAELGYDRDTIGTWRKDGVI